MVIGVVIVKNKMSEEIISQIDDRLEKRFESYAQVQNALHKDLHDRLLIAVETQIKTTVNGKIDAIKKQLDSQDIVLKSLDERIKPFEEGVSWFSKSKTAITWLAGFITPLAIVGGAIMWLKKNL